MKPLNNMVFVKQILMNEKYSEKSGLFIPSSTQERSQEAEVVAVGPGDWAYGHRMPIDLNPGDRVLFLRRGYDAVVNGEKVMALTDRDILAVLEDDDSAEFYGTAIDSDIQREALGTGF